MTFNSLSNKKEGSTNYGISLFCPNQIFVRNLDLTITPVALEDNGDGLYVSLDL